MTDKVKEITEKIYNEGVVKAKEEAESIIAEAKEEAKTIIQNAKQEKSAILKQAANEAEDLYKKTQGEIELAAQKLINNLKQHIADELISIQVGSTIHDVFESPGFIREMILLIIKNWVKEGKDETNLNLILSPEDEKKLAGFFESKLMNELDKGIEINVDAGITSGFKIGPKDGNFIVSFTENDFENYFKYYLKDKTWKLIFNQGE